MSYKRRNTTGWANVAITPGQVPTQPRPNPPNAQRSLPIGGHLPAVSPQRATAPNASPLPKTSTPTSRKLSKFRHTPHTRAFPEEYANSQYSLENAIANANEIEESVKNRSSQSTQSNTQNTQDRKPPPARNILPTNNSSPPSSNVPSNKLNSQYTRPTQQPRVPHLSPSSPSPPVSNVSPSQNVSPTQLPVDTSAEAFAPTPEEIAELSLLDEDVIALDALAGAPPHKPSAPLTKSSTPPMPTPPPATEGRPSPPLPHPQSPPLSVGGGSPPTPITSPTKPTSPISPISPHMTEVEKQRLAMPPPPSRTPPISGPKDDSAILRMSLAEMRKKSDDADMTILRMRKGMEEKDSEIKRLSVLLAFKEKEFEEMRRQEQQRQKPVSPEKPKQPERVAPRGGAATTPPPAKPIEQSNGQEVMEIPPPSTSSNTITTSIASSLMEEDNMSEGSQNDSDDMNVANAVGVTTFRSLKDPHPGKLKIRKGPSTPLKRKRDRTASSTAGTSPGKRVRIDPKVTQGTSKSTPPRHHSPSSGPVHSPSRPSADVVELKSQNKLMRQMLKGKYEKNIELKREFADEVRTVLRKELGSVTEVFRTENRRMLEEMGFKMGKDSVQKAKVTETEPKESAPSKAVGQTEDLDSAKIRNEQNLKRLAKRISVQKEEICKLTEENARLRKENEALRVSTPSSKDGKQSVSRAVQLEKGNQQKEDLQLELKKLESVLAETMKEKDRALEKLEKQNKELEALSSMVERKEKEVLELNENIAVLEERLEAKEDELKKRLTGVEDIEPSRRGDGMSQELRQGDEEEEVETASQNLPSVTQIVAQALSGDNVFPTQLTQETDTLIEQLQEKEKVRQEKKERKRKREEEEETKQEKRRKEEVENGNEGKKERVNSGKESSNQIKEY